jgi:hypothetical protein
MVCLKSSSVLCISNYQLRKAIVTKPSTQPRRPPIAPRNINSEGPRDILVALEQRAVTGTPERPLYIPPVLRIPETPDVWAAREHAARRPTPDRRPFHGVAGLMYPETPEFSGCADPQTEHNSTRARTSRRQLQFQADDSNTTSSSASTSLRPPTSPILR